MSVRAREGAHQQQTFIDNLQCFPAYIRAQIQAVDLADVWARVQIMHTVDGHPFCRYRDGEHWVQINSAHPVTQAQNWANPLGLADLRALFVYGAGFGYALTEVLHRVHSDTVVVVFEREIHIFIAMLHAFDLRPLFQKHDKCIFFIGDTVDIAQHFSALLLTEHVYDLTMPSVVYAPESKHFKTQYTQLHQYVFDRLAQQTFARGNDHYDSLLGLHNMVDNAGVIAESPFLPTLKNRFQGKPVFIVANGPSLDRNIHLLKQIGGKGLILCCESAIAPLMKNGILPDAIIVAERVPASYLYHFQNVQYPDTIALLALTVADPRTFRSFSGPKIPIFRSMESNSQWLNRILADGEGLPGGINVSHLAFELAVYVGADPIVFVGQDLAFGADGTTHSRHAKYTDEGQDYIEGIKQGPVVYVEGNDGALIPSTPAWVDYKKWLEQLIQALPALTVINATAGGAHIEGTQRGELQDVINQYCTANLPHTLHGLIASVKQGIDVKERQKSLQHLIGELRKYVEIYRALKKFAAETSTAAVRVWEDDEQPASPERQQRLQAAYAQNKRALARFLQPHVHHVFLQQPILYGLHRINRLGALHSFARLRDALWLQVTLFDHLALVCDSLAQNFHIAAEKATRCATAADDISQSGSEQNEPTRQ